MRLTRDLVEKAAVAVMNATAGRTDSDQIRYDLMQQQLAALGFADGRTPGFGVPRPDYTELGMDWVAGPPTAEHVEMYRKVTLGGKLTEDSLVVSILLSDTDLKPDRYGVFQFKNLVELHGEYLGRQNDTNHSFDQKDAAGRIIDLWIGTDAGVEMHPDYPRQTLSMLDYANPFAGQYAALCGLVAFPSRKKASADAIEDLMAGIIQDVSTSYCVNNHLCSICGTGMESFWMFSWCEEHGFPGQRQADGTAVVQIADTITRAMTYGHVTDGAVRRARYVLDPTIR